jgi:hypothetical protein
MLSSFLDKRARELAEKYDKPNDFFLLSNDKEREDTTDDGMAVTGNFN